MNNWTDERVYNQDLPRSIDYPNVPVGAILKGSARRFGSRNAYIYEGQGIMFEELY
ncbi:hypothetical protein J2Y03_001149 [Neobacillus niacini]|uniref:hypothetical protein n=1 Tax=Neobacillus niacini TaxID=86668 RepID=UPI002855CD2E|nr:hypothetical protein [Neobacillus niacini]MDR7076146.1 hypothetical protein [Neobacillus niacini]